MITVIIAGGSGTRLWPLSTSTNPKQLLSLTGNRSMVQQTYDRAKKISSDIYVVPDISHAEALKNQLSELGEDNFVIEPGRRGTANCIVAALVHVAKRHDHDEPIAFLSADHHIRDVKGFTQSFKTAGAYAKKMGVITLVGVEPNYPAVGFGYIQAGNPIDESERAYEVTAFKEKPDFETAKKYLQSGEYLWNCGYFVGSLNTFVNEMQEFAPDLYDNYTRLLEASDRGSEQYTDVYESFESDTIDYALIEKASKLLVVPAAFDWMDVGNFKDLHDANEQSENGNYFHGKNIHDIEVENVFVRNEEPDKPIAVIGLDNVVVVNTKDGILVARKDLSSKVGDIAKKIQS